MCLKVLFRSGWGSGVRYLDKLCFLIMNMASAKHLLKRNYKKLYIMNDLNKEKSTMEAFENLSKRIRAVFKKGGDTQEVPNTLRGGEEILSKAMMEKMKTIKSMDAELAETKIVGHIKGVSFDGLKGLFKK